MPPSLVGALRQVFAEPTPLAMTLLASLTVHASTWRASWRPPGEPEPPKEQGSWQDSRLTQEDPLEIADFLAGPTVLILPFLVSVVLLAMFWFGDVLGPLLIIVASVVGVATISFVLLPVVARLGLGVTAQRVVLGLVASTCIVMWLLTGSWVANDIIAASLCITGASIIRIPSLKSMTLLGIGLVVYVGPMRAPIPMVQASHTFCPRSGRGCILDATSRLVHFL